MEITRKRVRTFRSGCLECSTSLEGCMHGDISNHATSLPRAKNSKELYGLFRTDSLLRVPTRSGTRARSLFQQEPPNEAPAEDSSGPAVSA